MSCCSELFYNHVLNFLEEHKFIFAYCIIIGISHHIPVEWNWAPHGKGNIFPVQLFPGSFNSSGPSDTIWQHSYVPNLAPCNGLLPGSNKLHKQTLVDLSSKVLCGIHFIAISQEALMSLICNVETTFLAATKQLYEWYFLSVCLSVTPFWLCSIIVSSWNFQELSPRTRVTSMQKVKVRGQRSRS